MPDRIPHGDHVIWIHQIYKYLLRWETISFGICHLEGHKICWRSSQTKQRKGFLVSGIAYRVCIFASPLRSCGCGSLSKTLGAIKMHAQNWVSTVTGRPGAFVVCVVELVCLWKCWGCASSCYDRTTMTMIVMHVIWFARIIVEFVGWHCDFLCSWSCESGAPLTTPLPYWITPSHWGLLYADVA